MKQVVSYLSFNGTCKEAMTFYQQCLGGTLSLTTVGESSIADRMPEKRDAIMHSTLMREGLVLIMAADAMGDSQPSAGRDFSLMIDCESETEIRDLFTKLSEGGAIISPLKEEFWGGLFGQFTDKFGKPWMLNYQKQ